MCRACWVDHGSTTAILRKLGVLGNKHIPAEYLRAAESQRRALLAGLLDTDGYVARNGTVQFAVTNRRLAAGTLELVLSLGYRARMTTKRVKGGTEESSTCYMVTFTPADKVFRLTGSSRGKRHGAPDDALPVHHATSGRSKRAGSLRAGGQRGPHVPGRATMIPTHNSTLALDLARAASVKHGLATVIFSLEMSRNEITMRLLSAEARVPLHAMRTGQLSDDDWTRLARRMSEVVRRAAVHRRLAEPDADGDPGQVPAAEAAQRPADGRSSTTCS